MGRIEDYRSKLKSYFDKQVSFAIDETPNSAKSTLKGWIVDRTGPVTLRLTLQNEVVWEGWCECPRPDVFRNFLDLEHTLFSGFQIDFPENVLFNLGSDKLSLLAVSANHTQVIWTWQGTASANEPQAIKILRDHFLAHAFIRSPRTFPSDVVSLHVIVQTIGQYPLFISNLTSLEKSLDALINAHPGFSVKLGAVTVLLAGEAKREEVERLISSQSQISGKPITLVEQQNFAGSHETDLVLFIREQADISALDIASLVSDFIRHPFIVLLMPTLFGGPHGISGPADVRLVDLHRVTSLHGINVPVLFATKQLGPVWLSTTAFLKALQNHTPQDHTQGIKTIEPPSGTYTYHQDLRQPIYSVHPDIKGHHTQELQPIFDRDVSFPARRQMADGTGRETSGRDTIVVLLPEHWNAGQETHGASYQLCRLSKELERCGKNVIFVHDIDTAQRVYLDGIPAMTLQEFVSSDKPPIHSVIATNWTTVRTAHLLHYLTGARVINFMQHLESLFLAQTGRDQLEHAVWSYRGDFVPLSNNTWFRETFQSLRHGRDGVVTIPTWLNGQLFQPLPLLRREKSLLVMMGSNQNLLPRRTRLYSDVIKGLREKHPDLFVTLCGHSQDESDTKDLLGVCDKVYGQLSAYDLARLYSSHQVVIVLGSFCGSAVTALEIMACGAVAVLSDETGSQDFARPGENCLRVNVEDRNGIVDAISGPLFDRGWLEQLQRGALETAARYNDQRLEQVFGQQLWEDLERSFQHHQQRAVETRRPKRAVSIIIPVYGALDSTSMCLRSVLQYVQTENTEIIVVNDKSDSGTTNWLREISSQAHQIRIVEMEENVGFIQACIAGVNAAKEENDILLLNSDVVLTAGSVEGLQEAAYAHHEVGLASPLSTASPHLQLDVNAGDSLVTAAEKIKQFYTPQYPTVITPEGQMLFIKRWALEEFGFFDSVFQRGFCEESDMSMRMFLNGVDMICADNVLVYHRRSASFGKETRAKHIQENRPIFDARWERYYRYAYQAFLKRDPLKELRLRYRALAEVLEAPKVPLALESKDKELLHVETAISAPTVSVLRDVDIVFVLPGVILGGGSLSVLQHVNELLARGVNARVVSLGDVNIGNYPLLAPVISVSKEQFFQLNWSQQKVVATFWTTAYLVKSLTLRFPQLRGYYYVQDYEPWFYSRPEEFPAVKDAEASYALGLQCVCKTEFLAELLKSQHQVQAEIIRPGIDLSVFYPGNQERYVGRPRLASLFRPRTTRRGNKETIELVRKLKQRMPEVEVNLFGESTGLPEDLVDRVSLRGVLTPREVAELYRSSDVVLDLSYWQGFGRMGIEGMACGAVPVVSNSGGVLRYARDQENSFLVNIDHLDDVVERLIYLLKERSLRLEMREKGIDTARSFSEIFATDDWCKLFGLADLSSDHLACFGGLPVLWGRESDESLHQRQVIGG